jgi:homoserine kinase
MEERTIRVRVPGTSANCGPGFDTLGLACNIYNDLELTLTTEPGLEIQISGEGAENIPCDERNICWQSVQLLLERASVTEFKGARIHMLNRVPLSRGLGSSATAIVAGLKAANVIIGNRYNRYELLQFANEIEGHPDNVAQAIYGGFTVNTVSDGHVECFSLLPKLRLALVVAIPPFPLSTRKAREVLPEKITRQDAVYNISRAAMLTAALVRGNERFLKTAFDDVLHQPYRSVLIPGMYEVFKAAREAGAVGANLSGAGPCLIAYVPEKLRGAERVGEAMCAAFRKHGVNAECKILALDTRGAHIINH